MSSCAKRPLDAKWSVLKILPVTLFALMLTGPVVPLSSQSTGRDSGSRQSVASPEELVDINHASLEQLLRVPGLTRSWAGRIVRFRPYRSKLDLFDVGVLPGDVYNRIKDHIIAHRDKK
jgi:DNA uptake protein ComE-like DNA-binding protein